MLLAITGLLAFLSPVFRGRDAATLQGFIGLNRPQLDGFIHDVAFEHYLRSHPHLHTVEFYLCGPPMMIRACTRMLTDLGINPHQIAFDEF